MNNKRLAGLATGMLMLSMVGATEASIISYSATLDGLQGTAPITTTGMGSMVGTYDDVSGGLTWTLNWSDLLAPATAAHIHIAPSGFNGPVAVTIPSVAGSMSGMVSSSTTITMLQAADLLAGNWYVNIHSSQFPAGEIRGQLSINSVPEPTTVLLLSMGVAGLLGSRMRNKGVAHPV